VNELPGAEPAVAPSDTPTIGGAPRPAPTGEEAPAPPESSAPPGAPTPRPASPAPGPRPTAAHIVAPPASRVVIEPPLSRDDPERLNLPGMPGAWFYRPSSASRQRVLVYLHSRGANPRDACRRWHESTPRFGWLVCPIGQVDRGNGRHEWNNNAQFARREAVAAVEALYARFPRRVRRHDNVIMGFSEGAFTAMNVGLMEPLTFPRWFIIASHDGYIDGEEERITRAALSVQRVFLLTGIHDEIVERSRRAFDVLRRAFGRRHVRLQVLEGAGHELPPDFYRVTRGILLWITQ
jgi:predicted esterase